MKLLTFITATLAAVSAWKAPFKLRHWKGYENGDRYFYYPGDDGKVYPVDSSDPVDENAIRDYTCCPVNNGYWLYTRKNPSHKQHLIMGDESRLTRSYFDALKTTIFLAHGWIGDGHGHMSKVLTKVLLKGDDVNVIVLDWSRLAKKNYVTATLAVPRVGQMLGKFIKWLSRNFRMSLHNVHLVGYSLGGHLVGNAGKELGGRVGRITALDPAGPLWYLNKRRVAKSDGKYVEVIHTNSFMCGYPFPAGHSDYYPNGGKLMTGCRWWDIACHHDRSWKYMASSIENNKFAANKCINVIEVWVRPKCHGKIGKMGNNLLDKHERGLFKIKTKANYPYI